MISTNPTLAAPAPAKKKRLVNVLSLKRLPIGQLVRFSDGATYRKTSSGNLIRDPAKSPSRRDRRRILAPLVIEAAKRKLNAVRSQAGA